MRVLLLCSMLIISMVFLVHGYPQMGGQRWGQQERGNQMGAGIGLNLGLGMEAGSSNYNSVKEGGANGILPGMGIGSPGSIYNTGFRRRREVAGCNRGRNNRHQHEQTTTTATTTTTPTSTTQATTAATAS